MKTISLTELRRNPLAALRAVRKGHGIRVTRRDAVIEEIEPFMSSTPSRSAVLQAQRAADAADFKTW